jgi:hypothetical protein
MPAPKCCQLIGAQLIGASLLVFAPIGPNTGNLVHLTHHSSTYSGLVFGIQLAPLIGMPRPLRFVPPSSVVEVSTCTIQRRFLLRPSKELNEILLGILGRALSLYPIALHAFAFASNHVQLLLSTSDAKTLAQFMNHVNSNIAREAGRLHAWREKFWGRRYRSIPVLDDKATEARLRYILEHGCKEGLVRKPSDWPGASCLPALLHGKVLRGVWFDRTAEYRARRKGLWPDRYEFATYYDVPLTPIPCWSHLSLEERQLRAAQIVAEIKADTAKHAKERGSLPPGPEFVCTQDPHDRPCKPNKSPAPLCHASSRQKRKLFREAYAEFSRLFFLASANLRVQQPRVLFPEYCFPPAHGFFVSALDPSPS